MRRTAPLLLILAACAPTPARPAPPVAEPVWKLTPLHTGVCTIGADHALGGEHTADERLPFVLYSFLAESPKGDVVLIDLGPKSLDTANAMFRRHGFIRDLPGRPDDIRQPHGNVFDQLARRKIPKEYISLIVFTHFQPDHHGIHDGKDGGAAQEFPYAQLSVSRKGWDWNVAQRKNGQWTSYMDCKFGDFLLGAKERGRLETLDDGPLRPGLEVLYLGGHSVCSRAVKIRTPRGWAIITSDEVYRYDLLEKGVTPRLNTSAAALVHATDQLVRAAKASGAILLPLHDPAIWEAAEKGGDAWLDRLRPLSDRAIEAWSSRRG